MLVPVLSICFFRYCFVLLRLATDKADVSLAFVEVATCTRDRLTATLLLEPGFRGLVYARGYPLRCRQAGNGQARLRLSLPVSECGTRVTEQTVRDAA